jgi:hypothetical protein
MWIYCFIGYLAISSSISYANGTPKANSTKVQDKRQIEHQTRVIQIGNQREYLPKNGQHLQHHQQSQSQPQQQQQFTQDEIPADYLSLLQELQYQQSISPQSHPQYFDQPIHAAPSRSQAPQHSQQQQQQQQQQQFGKPSGKQQKVANIQYHLPSAPSKEPQKSQQQQVIYAQQQQQHQQQQQQEPKFQYISEEEYLQLIKQQEQEQQNSGLAQYQTRGQPTIQHQQRPQQKQPKFRPSPAPEHLQFIQPQQQEQLVQYRQRPVAAALQQQPPQQFQHFGPRPAAGHARPFGDSSFEKELQRIVESNKPVHHFEQRPQKPNSRQHQKQGPFFAEEFVQPQPQPTQATRYVTPNLQSKSQQIQPSQKPKYESPASKYQLVVQPTVSGEVIYKNQQQQQQQQQFFVSSYPKPTGQPLGPTKVKYYTQAKEKPQQQQQQHHRQQTFPGISQQAEFQEYLLSNPTIEPQNYEAQANVMKIVDPPQLQYEKPTAAQLQQAKEYQQKAPSRSAQIQQTQQQNVPSKSQIFVSQSTGAPSASTPSSLSAYYEQQQAQQQQEQEAQQYQQTRQEKGENKLNIPLPDDRPLTQEEFQALVDAGFPVVPVPVPVPSTEYEKYAASPQITPRPQQSKQQRRQPNNKNAPHGAASRFAQSQRPSAAQSYNRYQQQADASSLSLTYLRPIDHFKSGLHGPQKINA